MYTILLLVLSVLFIVISTTRLKLHPFLALLFAAIGYGVLAGMPLTGESSIVASINGGFGSTLGSIGIVIIAGTIIGTFLEQSGGAFAMADKLLKWVGKQQVPLAMSVVGYIVSIPVFADSGFVILQPLNKALSKKAGITLAASVMALGLGLGASHTMMPPTPGPIAAAGILGADLGAVIMLGFPISLLAMLIGWLYATTFAARTWIDPKPDVSDAEIEQKRKNAPKAFHAFIPILVPIILIVLKSVSALPSQPLGDGVFAHFIAFIGEPVVALLLGVLLAFTLPRSFDKEMLSTTGWVGKGVLDAAIIIMITGAGGSFGKMLQNSGMANVVSELFEGVNLGIWLAFILAAAIKTAQGSSTVAIITTASIVSPLLATLGLATGLDIACAVLMIGAGSLVVSHANDSFFWIVTQMSDMDVRQGYKLHSLGTLVMGTGAALIIWLVSLFV